MYAVHLVATAILAASIAWVTNRLALVEWRRAKDAHWTERARRLYPARIAAVCNLWVIPANVALAQLLLFPTQSPHWVFLGLAGWAGAVAGTRGFDCEVCPDMPLKSWLHQAAVGSLLRLSSWLLLLSAIALMPTEFGWNTVIVAVAYVALHITLSWRTLSVLKVVGILEPPSEELRNLVLRMSARMNVRVNRVWMMKSASANAFAMPIGRELVFNKTLLNLLTTEELEAVCAHELGHLTESATNLLVRILGSLPFLPWIFLTPLTNTFGILGFIATALAMIGLIRGYQSISRRLERRADSIGHIQETSPGVYAKALEKLHEDNLIPAVLPERQTTHPHLYDRLIAAGVTPDYPRPIAAEAMAPHGHFLSGLFGALLVLYGIQTAKFFNTPPDFSRP